MASYYKRPEIKPWTISEHVNGGWCIEARNEYSVKSFYYFNLPPWQVFWDEKKKYLKLRAMAQRWMDSQDREILQVQKMFDARNSTMKQ